MKYLLPFVLSIVAACSALAPAPPRPPPTAERVQLAADNAAASVAELVAVVDATRQAPAPSSAEEVVERVTTATQAVAAAGSGTPAAPYLAAFAALVSLASPFALNWHRNKTRQRDLAAAIGAGEGVP